jgi:hypothetical protein
VERLGETVEFGRVLVELLVAAGWRVDERPLLGGVLLIATGHGTAEQAFDDEYGGAAGALFERCMALKVWRQRWAA